MGNLHENSSDSTILNEGLAQLGLASEKDEFLFFVQDKETFLKKVSVRMNLFHKYTYTITPHFLLRTKNF